MSPRSLALSLSPFSALSPFPLSLSLSSFFFLFSFFFLSFPFLLYPFCPCTLYVSFSLLLPSSLGISSAGDPQTSGLLGGARAVHGKSMHCGLLEEPDMDSTGQSYWWGLGGDIGRERKGRRGTSERVAKSSEGST